MGILATSELYGAFARSSKSFILDENGAAFLEYTVLLGIILVIAIVTLAKVGNYANTTWSTLCSTLGSSCS